MSYTCYIGIKEGYQEYFHPGIRLVGKAAACSSLLLGVMNMIPMIPGQVVPDADICPCMDAAATETWSISDTVMVWSMTVDMGVTWMTCSYCAARHVRRSYHPSDQLLYAACDAHWYNAHAAETTPGTVVACAKYRGAYLRKSLN